MNASSSGSAGPNPLLEPWTGPLGLPPFGRIEPELFRPAFDCALDAHRLEVAHIADATAVPTFDDTIAALERSGQVLQRVAAVFFNLAGADTNDVIQAIEREITPVLARHRSEIMMDDALWRRVDLLHGRSDELGLSAEQRRVLDRYRVAFRRAGAHLDPPAKRRLMEITGRLASLYTAFSQNVLADENAATLVLEGEDDLAGLPDFVRAASRRAASDRGLDGKHLITLSRSSVEPFLKFSARRDLRERAFKAWIMRGDTGGPTDNKAIAAEIVALRTEEAKLLGFPTFAHFRLDDCMARTPDAVLGLLTRVWEPAQRRAHIERAGLDEMIRRDGGNFDLEAWDWRYYAEKQRKAQHDLDEADVKPYLQLERMIEAAFETAHRLFALGFRRIENVALYHPDVRAWEVTGADGRHVGLFLGDYFARPSKRSGAWMSSYRPQQRLVGDIPPIVVNVMNFAAAAPGEPCLLSFDDCRTLFHEFGHALHGLLSDVTYPMIAGTNVARDFVELPSQLFEHWLEQPEILNRFAVHYRTGQPMPQTIVDRLRASRNFGQGFATVEYVASALVDLDFHLLDQAEGLDVAAFERASLERIGMPAGIVMRHRTPHFSHVFSGDGYSSAYYSYLWAEVLDADAFKAFEETGDPFDPATASRLREFVYSAGSLRDAADAYRAFRGRMPTPDSLMEKRGLVD